MTLASGTPKATDRGWMPIEDLMALVRVHGPRTSTGYKAMVRLGTLGPKAPIAPNEVYKNEGWPTGGWPEFLGVKPDENGKLRRGPIIQYMSYPEAVKTLAPYRFESKAAFLAARSRKEVDRRIPREPDVHYPGEFTTWEALLGLPEVPPPAERIARAARAAKDRLAPGATGGVGGTTFSTTRVDRRGYVRSVGPAPTLDEFEALLVAEGIVDLAGYHVARKERLHAGGAPSMPERTYGKAWPGWRKIFKKVRPLVEGRVPETPTVAWVRSEARKANVRNGEDYERAHQAGVLHSKCPRVPAIFFRNPDFTWASFLAGKRAKSKPGSSHIERAIRACLRLGYTVKVGVIRPAGGGRALLPDYILPDWDLSIDFDSSYYHDSKEARTRDRAKTTKLRSQGKTHIRVRQEPLERLFDDDLMVPANLSPQGTARRISAHIATLSGGRIPDNLINISDEAMTHAIAIMPDEETVEYQSYEATQILARNAGIPNGKRYRAAIADGTLPPDCHGSPQIKFKDIWMARGGWHGFLGTKPSGRVASETLEYEEAQPWVAEQHYQCMAEFRLAHQKGQVLKGIPKCPAAHPKYKGKWQGEAAWLGKPVETKEAKFLRVREAVRARRYPSRDAYIVDVNNGAAPDGATRHPNSTFAQAGFTTMANFLGLPERPRRARPSRGDEAGHGHQQQAH